jgi:hypothetical protein
MVILHRKKFNQIIMQSKPKHSLQQLLALEDDDALLQYYCPGTTLPAWALIRVQFIRTIMSELLFSSGALIGGGNRPAYLDLMKFLVRSQLHNIVTRQSHASEICFFTTGLGNFERNNISKDRLVGYFADCYPSNSLIYQDHGGWRWNNTCKSNSLLYATPYNFYLQILGRLTVNNHHKKMAYEIISYAIEKTKDRLGYIIIDKNKEILIKSLSLQLAIFPIAADYYANWLSQRRVKLLFKEDACYGARSIAILHAAKIANVTTAEYQHGAISKGHDGYNVAPALANSAQFRQTLPDYLLTYGNWWSQQTNMPLNKVAIGNPHLTESIKIFTKTTKKNNKILVLGDGIETQLYLNLAFKLAQMKANRGLSVVFRPHPLEREIVKSLNLPQGVELDSSSDIYDSLRESSLVISELSTGLFEAVGIVKKILLWETDKSRFAFPNLPFPSFSTIEELEEHLEESSDSSTHSEISISSGDLWEPNWELNYKNFVKGVLST